MVEHQPSKLDTRVRFPSPAPASEQIPLRCVPGHSRRLSPGTSAPLHLFFLSTPKPCGFGVGFFEGSALTPLPLLSKPEPALGSGFGIMNSGNIRSVTFVLPFAPEASWLRGRFFGGLRSLPCPSFQNRSPSGLRFWFDFRPRSLVASGAVFWANMLSSAMLFSKAKLPPASVWDAGGFLSLFS